MNKLIYIFGVYFLLYVMPSTTFANDNKINMTVGSTEISLLTPKGFCSSRRASPEFFSFHSKFSTSPKMKLQAYLISDKDCSALRNNTMPELSSHISLKTLNEFEGLNWTQKDFNKFRSMTVKNKNISFDALNEKNIKKIQDDYNKYIDNEIETEIDIKFDNPLPLGIYTNQHNAVGFTTIFSGSVEMNGMVLSELSVITTTFNLVKGKLIYSYVYSVLKTTKDIAWAESKAKELTALLFEVNGE